MRPPVACRLIAATALLLGAITTADAQLGISVSLPGASIGINVPSYPQLVPVPGYPVYYAPQLNSNYFFYDGMYWVYQRDNWYAATWYNGPWGLVAPEAVPAYILRVPVRYYHAPPAYFHGWRADAAPHWGEHWGATWEHSHSGWNSGTRGTAYAAAPLPAYQRQYGGSRYPHVEQQQSFHNQHYRYQPREPIVEQHYRAQRAIGATEQSAAAYQRAPVAQPPAYGSHSTERPDAPTRHSREDARPKD